jgi:hypothetical protein
VYRRPEPGTIAFAVRTDVIVGWTIQRAFPWEWISLFLDQIHVPCAIFLGDKYALLPSDKVEEYLIANMFLLPTELWSIRAFSMTLVISRLASGGVDTMVSSRKHHILFQALPLLAQA